jgi:hypothetical protein
VNSGVGPQHRLGVRALATGQNRTMNTTTAGLLLVLVFFGGGLTFLIFATAKRVRRGEKLPSNFRWRAKLGVAFAITILGTVVGVMGLLTPATPTPMTVLDRYTTNNGRTYHIDVNEQGFPYSYQVPQGIYDQLHQGRAYVCNIADLPVLGKTFESCHPEA